ncbi:MAG: hypothetical protein AAB476_01110 [Patescibacteria group bacterium]
MAVKKSKIKKDYNTVLLEKLGHDFGIFGEGLETVRQDVSVIKEDVNQLKDDMLEVKAELALIRHDLKEKVGRDEFKLLEQRVLRLEKTARAV